MIMNSIWMWIIILVVISLSWIIVEIKNAPMMDDDYGVKYKKDKDEKINK